MGHKGGGVGCAVVAALLMIAACGSGASVNPDALAPTDVQTPSTITIKIVSFNGSPASASLVAFQDGDLPWEALQGSGGVYHATASGGRYAVAVGCDGDAHGVTIEYRTVADGTEVHQIGCNAQAAPNTNTATLSGSLHGIASGEHGEVIATSPVSGFGDLVSQDGRYQVTVATSEALDLFARSFAAGPKRTEIPSKLFRGSHPAIAADQTLDIDFDRDGVAPQTVALTVAGGGGEPVTIITSIVTSTATIQLARQRYEGTLPSDYLAPAVSQSAPGDLLQLHVTTLLDASGPAYAYRNADTYHAVAAAQTVELPAPWSVDPPTLTATGARRPAFVFPVAADAKPTQHYEAQVTANAQLDPSLPLDTRYSKVLISGRYAAGQLRFTFAAPDLSALAGWSDAMGLPAGTSVAWYILLAENDVASPSHASDGDFKSNTVVGGILPP